MFDNSLLPLFWVYNTELKSCPVSHFSSVLLKEKSSEMVPVGVLVAVTLLFCTSVIVYVAWKFLSKMKCKFDIFFVEFWGFMMCVNLKRKKFGGRWVILQSRFYLGHSVLSLQLYNSMPLLFSVPACIFF